MPVQDAVGVRLVGYVVEDVEREREQQPGTARDSYSRAAYRTARGNP